MKLAKGYKQSVLCRYIADVKDPNGNVTKSWYNNLRQLTQTQTPLEYLTKYHYDKDGNVNKIERQSETSWQTTQYVYDVLDNKLREVDPLGHITYFGYNKNEDPNLVIDAEGNRTVREYNERGLLWKVTDGEGGVTEHNYDNNGNMTEVTDANGHATVYTYDDFDRAEKATDGENNYTTKVYDKLGHVTKETNYDSDDNPLMQKRFEYDAYGKLTRQAVMANPASSSAVSASSDMVTDYYYYNGNGVLAREVKYYGGGEEAVTDYGYDGAGRRTEVVDPAGNLTVMDYDELGRMTESLQTYDDPIGDANIVITTSYEYDQMSRLVKQTATPDTEDPDTWQITEYEYDKLGNRTYETKPNGVVTKFVYDLAGRLKEMTEDYGTGKLNRKTEYDYDDAGRQTEITAYADGVTAQTTVYTYDGVGGVTNILYPDGNDIDFVYNPVGRVIKRIDQRGVVTEYEYDDVYNMLAKIVDGNSVCTDANEVFTYDGLGRMKTADKTVSGTGTVALTQFAYNGIGRITDSNETLFGGTKREIDYGYDQAGNLVSTAYPYGFTVSITPEAMGRIDTIEIGQTEIASYKYIGPFVAERRYPEPSTDIVYQPSYDNLGRITSADSGTSYAKFDYGYQPNTNNIAWMRYDHRPNDPCVAFEYDNLDRLTDVDYGMDSTGEEFTYDLLGNRDYVDLRSGNENYVIDANNNRYMNIGGTALEYDAAGNLTKDKDGYEYEYDYENRIVKITKDSNDIAEFTYDALGRRVEKKDCVTPANTRRFYHNYSWQVLSEYDGSNVYVQSFVYGNYIDELLYRRTSSPGGARYYVHDHLFSPVAAVAGYGLVLGAVVERYEYDAYGNCHVLDSDFSADDNGISDHGNPYLFTGRRLDILDEGGLRIQHNRERYYETQIGRWLTQDPLDNLDGMNLYEYCKGNPIQAVDAYGTSQEILPPVPPVLPIAPMPIPPPCGRLTIAYKSHTYSWKATGSCPPNMFIEPKVKAQIQAEIAKELPKTYSMGCMWGTCKCLKSFQKSHTEQRQGSEKFWWALAPPQTRDTPPKSWFEKAYWNGPCTVNSTVTLQLDISGEIGLCM